MRGIRWIFALLCLIGVWGFACDDGGDGDADPRELRGLQREVESLQEENELLQSRIAKMRRGGGGGGDDDADSAAAVTALKRENRELRRNVRELEERQSDRGRGGAPDPRVASTLSSISDVMASWGSDFDSAAFAASELKRLIEMLDRIELAGLEPRDRRKLESIIRDVEPHATLEHLEDTLNTCLDRSRGMRKDIRSIRRMVED